MSVPSRRRPAALAVALLGAALAPPLAAACAPRAASSPVEATPIEVRVAREEEARSGPAEELVAEAAIGGGEPGATPLPVAWSSVFGPARPYAAARKVAHDARRAFEAAARAVVASADGGPPAPERFEQARSLLDQASRSFAGAYHAPDSTVADRIDALREAAEMLLAWSRQLDEAGLARAPATFRSDPAIALTYEDVASGPAKRWRGEGLALVDACVGTARASGSDAPAARECAAIRRRYARVLAARRVDAPDAGAGPAECACAPGDPLCSASMNGWCRPK